ncbi:MAG: magnesium transporter [Gemmatimonadota bacterium]|nr:magnesium transporter [Gemmatimonadota bacterium]
MQDQTEHAHERIEEIRRALERGEDVASLDARIAELHPADLAEVIDGLEEEGERVAFFRRIPASLKAETLAEVDEETWPELLETIDGEPGLRRLFGELEVDDAADILGELSREEARGILARIEPEESREISALMQYDVDSAGGVMTTEIVSVPVNLTADEAIVAVRRKGREVHDFYTVYVVDAENRLVGTLSLQDLILAPGETRVGEIMEADTVRVQPLDDQEDVARLIAKYNLVSIPVVDEFDHLLGRVTVDDVIDIIEAETTEDLFRLSGVDEEEERHASPLEIVRSRAPWLLITLGTSGLGALVVAQFEETIQRLAFIAVFMPVVAALAGNSAIQATTVAVRRLALDGGARPARSLSREVLAGIVIGGMIALILAGVAAVWQDSLRVGLVVGGSMWAAMAIGVTWGAAFPLILDRIGLDPAVSSSVFLTTMTDLVSFLLILGSASWFLLQWL